MNIIDGVAAYLESQGFGVVGTSIFKYQTPPTPDDCFVVYPAGGNDGLRWIEIDYPTIQIRARSVHPASGYNALLSIYRSLHGLNNITLSGGVLVHDTLGLQSQPVNIEKDDASRYQHIIQFTFDIDR